MTLRRTSLFAGHFHNADIRGSISAVLFALTRQYTKRLGQVGYTQGRKNLRCPNHDNRCPYRKRRLLSEWQWVIVSYFGFTQHGLHQKQAMLVKYNKVHVCVRAHTNYIYG